MFTPTLIACALAVATAAETVERPAHGLRLELPDGWKALDDALQGESLRLLLVRDTPAKDERLALRVFPSATVGDAQSARGLAEAAVASEPGYESVESFTIPLLGEERIAFGVDLVTQTPPLHLRQVYVEHGRWLLILESIAPVDGFDARWTEFARVWSGLERFEPVPDDPERARLEALAARCGEDVRWASTWEAAASRAREEKKPVLVVLRMYRGFQLSDPTLSSIFMQRAWIELVNTRFVPLRVTSLTGLPFASFDSYGLSATTFGATWLVVTPEGEVVGDHAFPVYDELVRNLDALPDLPGDPVTAEDPVERALALAARGELARAAAALDVAAAGDTREPSSVLAADPAAVLALAEVRLRMRDGAGVLDVLADVDATDLEAAPKRIEALIGLGRFDEARAAVDALRDRHGELDGGVLLWLGVLDWRNGERERAEALLRRTTLEHAEHRSAWIAAAVLLGTTWSADVAPGLAWPAREDVDELRAPTYAPLPVKRASAARDAAAAWLLAHQRADGLWFEPTVAARDARRAPHDFQLATSALALRALLREPTSDERDAALERGTRAVLDGLRAQRAQGLEALFMDYTVWSRACTIDLVAELVDAGRLARDEAEPLVASLRDELAERVQRNGGWSYYLTTDLESGASPAAQSISFTTAAVTLSLLRAREQDLARGDALDALIDGGLDCLEAMRDADGRFAYMQSPDVPRARDVAAPGAAGRGPVCTLALLRGGRARQVDLERALGELVAERAGLRREIGRALMHTGADGQGSHYLMWDYAMAAEAVEELPRRVRRRYRDALLEELLQARLDDGAFLGSPLLGRAHGAAEALRAFAHLDG